MCLQGLCSTNTYRYCYSKIQPQHNNVAKQFRGTIQLMEQNNTWLVVSLNSNCLHLMATACKFQHFQQHFLYLIAYNADH